MIFIFIRELRWELLSNKKSIMKTIIKDSIVLYTDKRGNVELRADVKEQTLWATQAQISELFEVNVRTVNEHLENIFKTHELKET